MVSPHLKDFEVGGSGGNIDKLAQPWVRALRSDGKKDREKPKEKQLLSFRVNLTPN